MAAKTQIKYLSIDLTIGGYELALETDDAKEIAELGVGVIKDKINTALKTGVTFRMEKGKVITVNLGEFIDWAVDKIDSTLRTNLEGFFTNATNQSVNALDGITIDLWDLSVSTKYDGTIKLDFTFCIKVTLDQSFYNGIFGGSPPASINKIFSINSIGFGISYTS